MWPVAAVQHQSLIFSSSTLTKDCVFFCFMTSKRHVSWWTWRLKVVTCCFLSVETWRSRRHSEPEPEPEPQDYQGPARPPGVVRLFSVSSRSVKNSDRWFDVCFVFVTMRRTWKPKCCFFYCLKKERSAPTCTGCWLLLGLFYWLIFSHSGLDWIPMCLCVWTSWW